MERSRGPQWREVGHQPITLDLEELHVLGQPREPMAAQAPEAEDGRLRTVHRASGLTRQDDLAAVGRLADPGRGVDRQPDVAGIRQGGAAAVQPYPDPAFEAV